MPGFLGREKGEDAPIGYFDARPPTNRYTQPNPIQSNLAVDTLDRPQGGTMQHSRVAGVAAHGTRVLLCKTQEIRGWKDEYRAPPER